MTLMTYSVRFFLVCSLVTSCRANTMLCSLLLILMNYIVILRITREFRDRKSTRLNSSHLVISYAVFCLKKKKKYCITFCSFMHKTRKWRAPHTYPTPTAPFHTTPSQLPLYFYRLAH